MAGSLTPFFGMWLVGLWIQTLLQGCGMLQTWLYFHWYKNDSWGIKAMVCALLVTETFQSVVLFQVTYSYLIDGFGDLPGLFIVRWQDAAQLFATYLSAFIVQMYFGYCIYILDRKSRILPAIILVLSLAQIGSGLVQTILTTQTKVFTRLDRTKAITTLEAATAFLCDVVITIALHRRLGSHKSGVKSTNNLLDRLMIHAINRGMLTAVCALVNLIFFLAFPNTFYFFLGLAASGKLYMNSALATLNSRQHVYSKAHADHAPWNTLPMQNVSVHSTRAANADGPVRIVVTKESETKGDNMSDYKRSNFMTGML